MVGQSFYTILEDKKQKKLIDFIKNTLASGKIFKGEIEFVGRGVSVWLDAIISPMYDEDGKIIKYMLVGQNISNKKLLEKISIVDDLTGVHNRRYFNEIIKKELARQMREKKNLTFIMMDVDYFKQYNDTCGHLAGDKALKAIGKTLNNFLKRGGDYVFRLGGEEFGVLFVGADKQRSVEFAQKLRMAIQKLKIVHPKNSASQYISVSMGLVVSNPASEIVDEHALYTLADSALYQAKQNGRNQVVVQEEHDIEFF
jgi:diguanylate cyclase (GGDEF)-like protein